MREADLFVLNLECCISERGRPAPRQAFFFRAPPRAAETLALLGVDCVTLANNHALDFGHDALARHARPSAAAGIPASAPGGTSRQPAAPAVLEAGGRGSPWWRGGPPGDTPPGPTGPASRSPISAGGSAVAGRGDRGESRRRRVAPHWGPNMVAAPVPHVRRAAAALATRARRSSPATRRTSSTASATACSSTSATSSTTTPSTAGSATTSACYGSSTSTGATGARRGGAAQARLLRDAARRRGGRGVDPRPLPLRVRRARHGRAGGGGPAGRRARAQFAIVNGSAAVALLPVWSEASTWSRYRPFRSRLVVQPRAM